MTEWCLLLPCALNNERQTTTKLRASLVDEVRDAVDAGAEAVGLLVDNAVDIVL